VFNKIAWKPTPQKHCASKFLKGTGAMSTISDENLRQVSRKGPIGVEYLQKRHEAYFRVWAPKCRRVEVVLTESGVVHQLTPELDGYFSGLQEQIAEGTLYSYRLDNASSLYPDPASRFQPSGPHGPSQIIDPYRFRWTDDSWPGLSAKGQVLYEMHIGTFTPEGTYASAMSELEELSAAGITALEIMPVADFAGEFGWGYDGVNLFAPTRLYGSPDELRAFVNRAHECGLGVILDVVYNHLGPDGNYLPFFSDTYISNKYRNDWGDAINFDGPGSHGVREFVLENAKYWIREFHFDGLRLDATQQIFDHSQTHILLEIVEAVRSSAKTRGTYIAAENEQQRAHHVRSSLHGGYGMDSLWNDDFHHSAAVVLTAHNEAYFSDHLGSPQEFISSIKYGYLFQGQRYNWQKKRRGTPALDLAPTAFVNFIENHDQVANSATGQRMWQLASPGRYRAVTALLLLAPQTPMLFQGQEFASSAPFLYFADHVPELSKLVDAGRKEFLSQFPSINTSEGFSQLSTASERITFERCKLDLSERRKHPWAYALHKDLLALRRADRCFSAQQRGKVDGAVLSAHAFVLRYFGEEGDDRLVLVNFGYDLNLNPAPEPLLAPPLNEEWRVLWSSEHPTYGGAGTPPLETADSWRIPGEATVVMAPQSVTAGRTSSRHTPQPASRK
jgi:maltooligosyltrehalose trehalohydrolase